MALANTGRGRSHVLVHRTRQGQPPVKPNEGSTMRVPQLIFGFLLVLMVSNTSQAATVSAELQSMIARHAKTHSVPEALVHRVIARESRYNPTLRNGPNWGLMQIREDTARSMGFSGPARRLLDPETNLTYAVAYLANAYLVAGGNQDRAVRLYSQGYYFEAKRRGMLSLIQQSRTGRN
jgi:soluble lytic murein transglycosylase-like protein